MDIREYEQFARNEVDKYKGHNDGALDRFYNGFMDNIYGLRENVGDVSRLAGFNYSEDGYWDNKQKEVRTRSKNYEKMNNSSDVAGGIGQALGYIPEFLLNTSTNANPYARAISNAVKFGLSAYGLDKAYNQPNAELSGVVAGTIAGTPPLAKGLAGHILGTKAGKYAEEASSQAYEKASRTLSDVLSKETPK
jgi:hypothetical protein